MVRLAGVLAAAFALTLAAPSRAATVHVTPDTANAIDYSSTAATTANVVTVTGTATAGTFRVTDTAEPLTPGDGCTAVNANTVDCTTLPGQQPIRQITADLGGGGDTFTNSTALSCICYGEGGGDTMNGGSEGEQLYGGPGMDTLDGGAGDDTLGGDEDADLVLGGDDDDEVRGGSGNDTLDGEAGVDRVSYFHETGPVTVDLPEPGVTATGQGAGAESDSILSVEGIDGSGEGDTLTGNSQTNVITGWGGDDTLNGGGGFDLLVGRDGSDTLNGGPADDFLDGGDGNDFLFGETGDDHLSGDEDFDMPGLPPTLGARYDDVFDGGDGLDTIGYAHRQSGVTATLPATGQSSGNGDTGSAENDRINANVEHVTGGHGNDVLTGNGLANTLVGGPGGDTLSGGAGTDTLRGDDGADTLHGGSEADNLSGDATFSFAPGGDTLNGDGGSDHITGATGADTINGGDGNDVLTGDGDGDTINGGADADLLQGGAGVDTLRGDAGTDTLKGQGDADDMGGGADADTAVYSDSPSGVKAALALTGPSTANGTGNGAENDTIQADVENLMGSDHGDELKGGAGANTLTGRSGNDILDVAGNGSDVANCGDGTDTAVADGEDTTTSCENGGATPPADTTMPTPTVAAPERVTSDKAPVFTGTAGRDSGDLPEIRVTIFNYDNGVLQPVPPPLGGEHVVTADAAGAWSIQWPQALPVGKWVVVVQQSDAAGNTGAGNAEFEVRAPGGWPEPTPTPEPTASPTATPPQTGPPPPTGKAPALVTPISVGGKPRVGAVLTAEFGGWINGVSKFRVTWRACDADGRSNCAPTRDADSFEHRVRADEKGRTFLFAVTASNSSGSTTRVSPPSAPATGAPAMPGVDRRPPITVKKAGVALRDAGICTESDAAACKDKMPVDLRLDGVARDDVPKELRRTIEHGEIFAQRPKAGEAVEQGDRVRLSFYDQKANKPSACEFANLSEAKVKKAFAGKLFSEAREKLQAGNCEHGWSVVAKDFSVPERKVTDAKVEFNTRGGRFIQLMLIEPEPVNYKPVPQVDTDKDGLWDEWETKGVDANSDGTIDLDLPAMGADPRHKDLFVELDVMESHPFDPGAASDMIAAFAAGDISNPDGVKGVTLHLDSGEDAVMNPKTGAKWGKRSNANQVPHQDVLGKMVDKDYDWGAFQEIKTGNFSPVRASVFRYVVNMHNHPKSGVTGTARGIPGEPRLTGPSDAIIGSANPCAAPEHCLLTRTQQAVNLMHEIGHLLGLGHGGRSAAGAPDHLNGKPNYLSIMSYSWSFTGVRVGDSFRIDFSPFPGSDEPAERLAGRPGSVMPLTESSLSELATTRAGGLAGAYSFTRYCVDSAGVRQPTTFATLNGGIDWDCADGIEAPAQSLSINTDSALDVLRSYDDWSNMTFAGGAIGDFNMVLPTAERHAIDEPTYEELQRAAAAAHGDAKKPALKGRRRGRSLKLTATDDKALAQVTVQVDRGEPKVYAAKGARLTRRVKLPRGRHRVIARATDAAGNRSKVLKVRTSGRRR